MSPCSGSVTHSEKSLSEEQGYSSGATPSSPEGQGERQRIPFSSTRRTPILLQSSRRRDRGPSSVQPREHLPCGAFYSVTPEVSHQNSREHYSQILPHYNSLLTTSETLLSRLQTQHTQIHHLESHTNDLLSRLSSLETTLRSLESQYERDVKLYEHKMRLMEEDYERVKEDLKKVEEENVKLTHWVERRKRGEGEAKCGSGADKQLKRECVRLLRLFDELDIT